jgi:hypothetical protein
MRDLQTARMDRVLDESIERYFLVRRQGLRRRVRRVIQLSNQITRHVFISLLAYQYKQDKHESQAPPEKYFAEPKSACFMGS